MTDRPQIDLHVQLAAALVEQSLPASILIPRLEEEGAEEIWSDLLGQWLSTLAPDLPPYLQSSAYSMSLQMVDDHSIALLNQAWRQQLGATDVLAFAAQESSPPFPALAGEECPSLPLELGDIVISLETAARQATEGGQSLESELLFLASHGLLHLLGWDHPDQDALTAMLILQEKLLASVSTLPTGGT